MIAKMFVDEAAVEKLPGKTLLNPLNANPTKVGFCRRIF